MALGPLITLQTQVEPLVKELDKAIKDSSAGIQQALLTAMWQVLHRANKSFSPAGKELVIKNYLTSSLCNEDSSEVRMAAAYCRAAVLTHVLDKDEARSQLNAMLDVDSASENALHAMMVTINVVVAENGSLHLIGRPATDPLCEKVMQVVLKAAQHGRAQISEIALQTIGRLLCDKNQHEDKQTFDRLLEAVSRSMEAEQSADLRRIGLNVLRAIGTDTEALDHVECHFAKLIPAVLSMVRDRNIPVKLAAERALLSLLELSNGEDRLSKCLKVLQPAEARQLSDYHRRVLVKLVAAEKERQLNPDEAQRENDDAEMAFITGIPSPV